MSALAAPHRAWRAALLAAALAAAPAAGAAAPDPAPRFVTGYWVGYQQGLYPPEKIDFGALTHLVVGRVLPRPDGTLRTALDIDDLAGPKIAADLARRAHAAGRKALLMIGGAGEHAGWVGASSPQNRARFVAELVATMRRLGYDGVDLDWEPLEKADKPVILELVRALRAAAPAAVITMPVSWLNANTDLPADPWYGQVAASLDQLNIMSYGMADAWGWQSWHSSAVEGEGRLTPSSVAVSARGYAAAGVPRAKIGLGIGFYGSCWVAPVTGPRQATRGSRVVASDNEMSYARIVRDYLDPAALRWDEAARASYLSFPAPRGPKNCTFVSFEDERSIAAKGALARAQGYGGAMIWTVNQGYLAATGRNPPLEAVGAAFLR